MVLFMVGILMYFRLEESGYSIGQKYIELVSCRDRLTKRETRIVNMLQVWMISLCCFCLILPQYVSNVVWKYLFNKPADNLERSTENEDECMCHIVFFHSLVLCLIDMIHEYSPITNAFVSVPADMGTLNCAAFLAGILAGILDSSRFVSAILLIDYFDYLFIECQSDCSYCQWW